MSSYRERDGGRCRDSKEWAAPRAGTDVLVIALLERIADGIDGLREELAKRFESAGAPVAANGREIDDKLLTPRQLAEFLGVHPRTLRAMQHAGEVPPPLRIGRAPRWRRTDIDAWLDRRAGPP